MLSSKSSGTVANCSSDVTPVLTRSEFSSSMTFQMVFEALFCVSWSRSLTRRLSGPSAALLPSGWLAAGPEAAGRDQGDERDQQQDAGPAAIQTHRRSGARVRKVTVLSGRAATRRSSAARSAAVV